MYRSVRMLIVAAVLSAVASVSTASTVGYAAIARANAQSFSGFVIAMTDVLFPTGVISGWQTYIGAIDKNASTGTMSLLVLNDLGGGNYGVVGSDTETVALGLNSFTSNIAVSAGNILAIWMGNANVAFDFTKGSGPASYSKNGAYSSSPAGPVVLNGGPTDRAYSINATVVPLPAAGLLLIGALGGLAALRRRNAT